MRPCSVAPSAQFFGTTKVEVEGEWRTPVQLYSDGTLRVMFANPYHEDNAMAIWFLDSDAMISERGGRKCVCDARPKNGC